MKFPRIPNPFRDLREARELLDEVLRERDMLKKLCHEMTETHQAELKRLDAFIVEDRALIKKLRADRENDLDALNAMAEERAGLIDQIEGLAGQFHNWAGAAMEEEAPMADEGSNVVVFSAKLKTRH